MMKRLNSNQLLRFSVVCAFVISLYSCSNNITNREDEKTDQDGDTRPNVVLIMTDDQGYGDFGFTGNDAIQTPNIDTLKKESVFMNNFYVSPVCSPTRASLMTGKFALRTGVYDTFNGGSLMASEEVTIAEILKANGYRTGIFGKWHLGSSYPFRPSDQGFDESLIHHGGGIGQPGDPENYEGWDSCYFNPNLYKNNKLVSTFGYCSDVFTDEVLNFMESSTKEPFFAYLAFNAPHDPLQVPQEWYDMYKELTFEIDSLETTKQGQVQMNEKEKENARKVYGMVSNIDYNVGRVIKKLEGLKILDNTIIVFLSDNGPMSSRYNAGLRALKGSTYDGGVKSPCLIRHPKMKIKGKVISTTTAHIDILPTIVELCGVSLNDSLNIDGLSMLPLFNGHKTEQFEKRNIYEQWGRMYPERYRNMSVRKGKYKLISHANYEADIDEFELYNTIADPSESTNLIAKEPELASQLKKELDAWFEKEVIINGNPKKVYIALNPDKEDSLILTRNEMKGPPEIWNNDFQYGYWDVDVQKSSDYDITFYFESKAKKKGQLIVKQHPLQYSKFNMDNNATNLKISNVKLNEGKGMLEVYYKTGWNETMIPFIVKIIEHTKHK